VVCAWGNHGAHQERSKAVVKLLRDAGVKVHVLRTNANGEPAHPLYLRGDLKPQSWVPD
jgi:hypothetical protein